MNVKSLFGAPAGLVLVLAMGFCAASSAISAEATKQGANSDRAKRGTSPRTEAVAQAALGDQLARHGDRNQDVLAMIGALRLLGQVGSRPMKPDMRTEGQAKAQTSKDGAAAARDATMRGLFTRARQYAGRRNDLNGILDELERSAGKAPDDGPARFSTGIGTGDTHVYAMTFRANEPVMIAVTGEGLSDLDLFVEDERGNRICAADSAGDDEICRWTPRWSGGFRIRVRNIGKAANAYRIWSN
jgi:hypothetical protein